MTLLLLATGRRGCSTTMRFRQTRVVFSFGGALHRLVGGFVEEAILILIAGPGGGLGDRSSKRRLNEPDRDGAAPESGRSEQRVHRGGAIEAAAQEISAGGFARDVGGAVGRDMLGEWGCPKLP